MYKFFLALYALTMLTVQLPAAAPMAVYHAPGKWYNVQSDYYRCTFYEGCMYPVWFYSADGKAEFPRGFLLDWIKRSAADNTQIYYLYNDRFAEVKIIENTPQQLIVECTGKFCKDTTRFPSVTARYRYTLKRNSPEIVLEGTLINDTPQNTFNAVVYSGVLAFRHLPFDKIQLGSQSPQEFRPAGAAPKTYSSDEQIILYHNDLSVGVKGIAAAWNNAFDRYYTYIGQSAGSKQRKWDGSKELKFKVCFYFNSSFTKK